MCTWCIGVRVKTLTPRFLKKELCQNGHLLGPQKMIVSWRFNFFLQLLKQLFFFTLLLVSVMLLVYVRGKHHLDPVHQMMTPAHAGKQTLDSGGENGTPNHWAIPIFSACKMSCWLYWSPFSQVVESTQNIIYHPETHYTDNKAQGNFHIHESII